MKSRIISLFLVVMMLFSLTAVSGVTASAAFIDVADNANYAEAVSALNALGLLTGYEDNSFRPDNTITRAEFATVVTRMLGMGDYAASSSSADIFTDVKTGDGEHWASGYIKIAYDLGIVNGMGNGIFAPDNPVTYEQAVKMIVCALGYGEVVLSEGGTWPNGYIAKANELNITKNAIVSPTDGAASRAVVALLVYNSLEVNMAEKSGSGTVVIGKKTIISDKLKMTPFINWMVTEIDGTESIATNKENLKPGQFVLVGGGKNNICDYTKVFDKAQASALLGNYISGYYKYDSDNDINIITYVNTTKSKSSEITVKTDDIDSCEYRVLKYYENHNDSKPKSVTISPDAILIYNGSVVDYKSFDGAPSDISYWLDPNSELFLDGTVRLVDTESDKKYDTIFIEDFITYVSKGTIRTTDTVYSNNYILYDLYDTSKFIQLDTDSNTVTVDLLDENGKTVDLTAIKANSVVSVAASYDSMRIKAYVSNKTVSGEVSEYDEEENIYVIGGKEYKATGAFDRALAMGKFNMSNGSTGTFYLDAFGRLAGATTQTESTGKYGYITTAGIVDDVVSVRLISLTGSPSTPTKVALEDTVKINGKKMSDPDAIMSALEKSAYALASNRGSDVSNADYSQPVKYNLSSSGKIDSLRTVELDGSEPALSKSTDDSLLEMYIQKTNLSYATSTGFKSKVFINGSTNVIYVPENRSSTDAYKRYTGTSYFKSGSSYEIEAYDVSNSGYAALVVVYKGVSNNHVSYATAMGIVNKVTTKTSSVNADESVYNIEVISKAGTKSYETENMEGDYANIKPGDCIRFVTNNDGQICEVKWDLDTADMKNEFKYDKNSSGTPYMSNGEYYYKTIFGTCSEREGDYLVVAPADVEFNDGGGTLDTENAEGFALNGSYLCYRVDLTGARPSISTATIDSVIAYDDGNFNASKVFVQAYLGSLRFVVVYVME